MKMKRPSMIIFDYGFTLSLIYSYDTKRGFDALTPYIKTNPHGLTSSDLQTQYDSIYTTLYGQKRDNIEFDLIKILRCILDINGIRLSVPMTDAAFIFFEGAESADPMPGIADLLHFLDEVSIRTGVISNLVENGEVLKRQIDRMLPENNFEFVITSSDYIFRKPMPHLFRVAIELSKLPPDEIWFCGDNTMADIMGAHSVGMFPVWFDFEAECPYPRYMTDTPECECLHIKNWSELVNYLKELT